MGPGHVHAEIGELVAGTRPGRSRPGPAHALQVGRRGGAGRGGGSAGAGRGARARGRARGRDLGGGSPRPTAFTGPWKPASRPAGGAAPARSQPARGALRRTRAAVATLPLGPHVRDALRLDLVWLDARRPGAPHRRGRPALAGAITARRGGGGRGRGGRGRASRGRPRLWNNRGMAEPQRNRLAVALDPRVPIYRDTYNEYFVLVLSAGGAAAGTQVPLTSSWRSRASGTSASSCAACVVFELVVIFGLARPQMQPRERAGWVVLWGATTALMALAFYLVAEPTLSIVFGFAHAKECSARGPVGPFGIGSGGVLRVHGAGHRRRRGHGRPARPGDGGQGCGHQLLRVLGHGRPRPGLPQTENSHAHMAVWCQGPDFGERVRPAGREQLLVPRLCGQDQSTPTVCAQTLTFKTATPAGDYVKGSLSFAGAQIPPSPIPPFVVRFNALSAATGQSPKGTVTVVSKDGSRSVYTVTCLRAVGNRATVGALSESGGALLLGVQTAARASISRRWPTPQTARTPQRVLSPASRRLSFATPLAAPGQRQLTLLLCSGVFRSRTAPSAEKRDVFARDCPRGAWRDNRGGRTVEVQANRGRTFGFGPCAALLLMVPNLPIRVRWRGRGRAVQGYADARGSCAFE